MRHQRLLRQLDAAWTAFKESYAGLSEVQLLVLDVTGAWSVRDIIAHVTTWEEEALKHLPRILEGERPPRYSVLYGGIDAFNALMTTGKKRLSLAELFQQQEHIHRQLVDAIDAHLRTHSLPVRVSGGDCGLIHTATIPSMPARYGAGENDNVFHTFGRASDRSPSARCRAPSGCDARVSRRKRAA
jgi:hypothetical protein